MFDLMLKKSSHTHLVLFFELVILALVILVVVLELMITSDLFH